MDNLFQILSSDWSYRGEGNANLVLSLPSKRQVLRIPKTFPNDDNDSFFLKHLETTCLNFHNNLMVRLLQHPYVYPAIQITTDKDEIEGLNRQLLHLRPAARRHKKLAAGSATLWPDYCFMPKTIETNDQNVVYSIEIKPKQGYWRDNPNPHGCDTNNPCPFCKLQHLKLQERRIGHISTYCPTYLFSGDPQRMKSAIKCLIEHPQNNFRLFKNGTYIYGENEPIEIFEKFCNEYFPSSYYFYELIVRAVTKNFSETKKDGCEKHGIERGALEEGCVLERILRMQMLDELGTNRWYKEYTHNQNCEDFGRWKYLQDLNFDEISKELEVCAWCFARNPIVGTKNVKVLPYVLSAIAQDCSVIVTFSKVKKKNGNNSKFVVHIEEEAFLVNVGIIDVYPKPASVIEKHSKREQSSSNAYKKAKEFYD